MDEFEKMTVELEIGMRKEDNEELFSNVYQQMFGKIIQDDELDDNDN